MFKCEDVAQGDRLKVVKSRDSCFCEGGEYEVFFTEYGKWFVTCECGADLDYHYLAQDCKGVKFELVKEAVPW